MPILLTALIIITCILLVIIVLVQNPKGGGLSSSFGGGGTQLLGGVKKTTDFLDRGTWTLSIVLLALVLGMNIMVSPPTAAGVQEEPESETIDNAGNFAPSLPANNSNDLQINQEDLPAGIQDEESGE